MAGFPIENPVPARQVRSALHLRLHFFFDTISPPHKTNDVEDEDEAQDEVNDSQEKSQMKQVGERSTQNLHAEIIGGTAGQGCPDAYDVVAPV